MYKLAKIKAPKYVQMFVKRSESIQRGGGVNHDAGGATAEQPRPRRKRGPRRSSPPVRAAERGPPRSLQNLQEEEQNQTSVESTFAADSTPFGRRAGSRRAGRQHAGFQKWLTWRSQHGVMKTHGFHRCCHGDHTASILTVCLQQAALCQSLSCGFQTRR